VISIFNVYFSVRRLILVVGEALMILASFLLVTVLQFREDSYLVLNFENGYFRIAIVTLFVLLLSYWLDLYEPCQPSPLGARGEFLFQAIVISGLLVAGTGIVGWVSPGGGHGRVRDSVLFGSSLATLALLAWRSAFTWLVGLPLFKERVYVLGAGERAQRLVRGLHSRSDLGVDVVGWTGEIGGEITREAMAAHLQHAAKDKRIHRIIVAMQDRRNTMPVRELLQLRLHRRVHIEEAASWLERISGKIELEYVYPSWIVFAKGFRFSEPFRLARRLFNMSVGLIGIILTLPIIPFVLLAIRLDSPGPVLYRQRRVGRNGKVLLCYKFRTMRPDAEVDTGPTWTNDDDPRITRVGSFLRGTRLDEIPQLWCVLKGDMAFVGPRPERPEFVEWLAREIPYYEIRHMVRPGITGWAQVRYKYGNSVEDAKEKLQYDLFYLKNASIGLDILILFHTIKIVLLRRGAQ
jgi:sugar transferase (PEP-CTERM system associated)